jgi:hypothetical protein
VYTNTEIAVHSHHNPAEAQLLYDSLIRLFQQIYAPFKANLKQYAAHLSRCFNKTFETSVKMTHVDIVDNVQLLSNSVVSVFNLIEKEIERCASLTNNCCFLMLIDALKQFLKTYIDEFRRVVLNLKERKSAAAAVTVAHSNQSSASTAILAARSVSVDELENWSMFRHFVRIIQTVGELIIKYENLEESIEKLVLDSFVHHNQTAAAGSGGSANLSQLNTPAASNDPYNLLSTTYFKDYYLLEDSDRNKLNNMISYVETGAADYTILKDLTAPLNSLSESVHKYSFDIVFAPIKFTLKDLSKVNLWYRQSEGETGASSGGSSSNSAIPMFALVPQEYVTKIGQYLLTLPQNFESFTMQDNTSLIIALRKGHLPYLDEKDLSDDLLACWLDSIANATYATLSDEILRFEWLSVNSQRQLIIDIEFICSVFDDVGLKDYTHLLTVLEFLKLEESNEDLEERLKNKPARIISFIRRIKMV